MPAIDFEVATDDEALVARLAGPQGVTAGLAHEITSGAVLLYLGPSVGAADGAPAHLFRVEFGTPNVAATAANVHDKHPLPQLLHGQETRVYGDSAYSGQGEAIRQAAPRAKDFTNQRAYRNRPLSPRQEQANHSKSKVRARGEHAFHVVKRLWGFSKVRYRGLAKNTARLFTAFALANLYLLRRR